MEFARADRAAPEGQVQCCMCGRKDLSTIEGDGGEECQLWDGRWTCSRGCYDKACMIHEAALTPPPAAPMEICSKCMGTGTAGHPDSGYTCDCNGGMVAAPTDNTALVEAACETLMNTPLEPSLAGHVRLVVESIRAALASREAQQPAGEAKPVGCGQPCGYDCNGACFDPHTCQQEAVAEADLAAARAEIEQLTKERDCLLYTSPSPRDS